MEQYSNDLTSQRVKIWDIEYNKGFWDYLKDDLELSRYQVVLQATNRYAFRGSILEVGCGEGILQSRMPPESYSKFLGIDISKVAIGKASILSNDTTQYRCEDMEKFDTEEKFDVVIFNESLYYAERPELLFMRYAYFLKSGGHIVISIFETIENKLIINELKKAYSLKENYISTNERGSWECLVFTKESII